MTSRHFAPSRDEWARGERLGTRLNMLLLLQLYNAQKLRQKNAIRKLFHSPILLFNTSFFYVITCTAPQLLLVSWRISLCVVHKLAKLLVLVKLVNLAMTSSYAKVVSSWKPFLIQFLTGSWKSQGKWKLTADWSVIVLQIPMGNAHAPLKIDRQCPWHLVIT